MCVLFFLFLIVPAAVDNRIWLGDPLPDVAMSGSQSCDRKSKIGLRHAMKLDSVYLMTRQENDGSIFL